MKHLKNINAYLHNHRNLIYKITVSLLTICLLIDFVHIAPPPGISSLLTPAVCLFIGLIFAFLCGETYKHINSKVSKYLLQTSIVGLGFGMNLQDSLASGQEGMIFTIISVLGTLVIGWFLGRKLLKIDTNTSYLTSAGTAICGGSAIAAVGPIIRAKSDQMSMALGTVFILNAIALFIFPKIGHLLGLSQNQFGSWVAIAIHDTSSVVGASSIYGKEALQVATTIKLTRALWIIPLALITSMIFKTKEQRINIPWFIILFVFAMLANTYLMQNVPQIGTFIADISRKLLTLTMFFIGASLSPSVISKIGFKPLMHGILLWIIISIGTLAYILL